MKRKTDGKLFSLSALPSNRWEHRQVSRKDYEVGMKLKGCKRVVTPFLLSGEGRILLEHVQCLKLQNEPMPLKEFIKLAVHISEAVAYMHERDILHNAIHPKVILYSPETDTYKLTGFGWATTGSAENALNFFEEKDDLIYQSPEGTGRVNRSVDFRSDIYSLGATFYYFLTGKSPYECESSRTLDIIHYMVTQTPPRIGYINPQVPKDMQDIVETMMAKNKDDRMQSAMSLFKILKTIQSNMENPEASEHVNVKNLKHAGKLYLPEKLYGREEELLTLFDEMNSVIQGKQKKNITLVSGISGIGKTGIVMELIHAIPPQQITFLMAKSDQLMSSVPYHILREAFTRWVTLICSREEENIHYWREKILHETFPDTRILFDIIPELEGIVGHVPEVAALPTVFETAKRFQSVWVSFLKALTSEKLLLLFIDDLQWTDPTSLELLQIILCHPELQNIMFVGAYRSNEKSHFFTKFVEMISVKQEIVQIELSSLTMSQTSNMLVDTFSASQEKIEELTKWVYTKTGGIPFGIKLFLKSLHEADLVRWDGDSWDWDIEKIASCNMNGSVVDLVIERIKLLSPECQKALSLASVVGHTFNLEVLAFLLNKDLVVTCSVLWYAVHANLICPSTSKCLYLQPIVEDATCQEQEYEDLKEFLSFSFAHDRIQTAAYQLLSENETWAAHIKLASYIERSTTDVIERVMHLNLACKALNREETKELIILNMRAATEAKSKMAYNQALDFVFAGEKCLEAFHSDEFSEVRFEFKTLKISLYFILLRLDDALDTIDKALEKRNELTDTQILELIHQKLNAYLKKGDFCTGLCLVNQVLGDTLTEVTKEDFCALADKILSMDKLDIGTKEVPYADLLFQGWVLSFLTGRVDWKIKYAFAMNVFLAEGGFSIHSAHFLTCLACTMANNYGDIEKSQMIYQLVKKYEPLVLPMPRLISRSMAVTHAFYYMPFSTLIDEFQDVLRESIHTGSYNWGAYAIKNAICFAWIGSYPLSYISQVTEYGLQYITKKVDPSFHRLILFYKHMADLVTRGNVDLTQPDILNTYLKTEHPSIITDFKAAKQAGDRNSWFSSLWGRLLIGVIFINRPNGIAFLPKVGEKIETYTST
eukprot:TRINITY_DN2145_c0_g1_i9.p1 TRINITY_DN2145_c0_g1~~TRINITY_DN2145_c0_g1_i9.p1  ORF type:complete len:1144 (-),score=141.97 TRINITY_DN2145_c0_g1_i9:2628-5960(-)